MLHRHGSRTRTSVLTIPQEAAVFLKKRAALEDEYGKGLQKLARATSAEYAQHEGKAG